MTSAPQELFMWFWHVPAPDEALLISGSKHQQSDTGFRIVIGRGSFVLPIKQKARILSLALREAEIVEDCATSQGIHLNVRAVAAFKIGDDPASIAAAARRFLPAQNRMGEIVGPMLAGHLRSIIGGVTVEQIITERGRVTQEIKKRSRAEMERLGIVVDALEIQEIEDTSGYISNLAAPHAAAVARQARIAQADADLEASEREREVAELRAQYERDLEIKRAGYLAETEKAKAEAVQAGPLTKARASQEVAEQQMVLARRQADIAALRLDAEVRQAADAEAYKRRALAEADRDQARFAADAEAYRMLAIARAETQAAKSSAEPAMIAENPDQGRRVRLRQRRDVSVVEQPAARRG
jgi:regulator of protease activity HflC (stomatin/prohibitin superfamily)